MPPSHKSRPLIGTSCKALHSVCLSFPICTKRVLIRGHWSDSNEIKIILFLLSQLGPHPVQGENMLLREMGITPVSPRNLGV